MTSKKSIPEGEIDLLILGDSQVMSGILPNDIQKKYENLKYKIFYYPRPSEQAEGIYHFLLTNVLNDKIKPKLIIWNISLIGLTKNGLVEAHKKLFKDRVEWNTSLYTDPVLNSFYLRGFLGGFEYGVAKLFAYPIVSSQLMVESSLVPKSLNLDLQTKQIETLISHNPIHSFSINYNRNQFILENLLADSGYYDWTSDENTNGEPCSENKRAIPGSQISLAFSEPREKAWRTWREISMLLEKKGIDYRILIIPFSPEVKDFLKEDSENSILSLYKKTEKTENIWEIREVLTKEDYGDYVHPNRCGAKKITNFIIEKTKNFPLN